MAVKKKYKKLTNAEKKFRQEVKMDLIEKGILPTRKKPLNRRKFAQEISKDLKELNISSYDLIQAIAWMKPSGEYESKITDEEVGVLKVCKMAIEYRKYVDKHMDDENAKVTYGDIYENVVKPIRDL